MSQLNWTLICIHRGSLSTGANPSRFYILVELGLPLHLFSGIHVVTIRPALYKKKPPYMFEMNKTMLRPNLDMPRGFFWFPGRNKNESLHKTDCSNVLSDVC